MNSEALDTETLVQATLNPILTAQKVQRVDLEAIKAVTVRRAREAISERELLILFRRQNAKEFLGAIRPGFHRFGFSKGQFSLIDIINAVVEQTGPARFALSTWTTAKADLGALEQLLEAGQLLEPRFLLDLSFQRRQPALIQRIRKIFGWQAIRVTKNHAKFMLFSAADWRIVCRTSMNLNFNPRLEDIELKDDPALYAFIDGILDAIFKSHDPKEQARQTVKGLSRQFNRDLGQPDPAPDPGRPPGNRHSGGRRRAQA